MTAADKAKIFLEALPYVQRFRDARFVIKYGGAVMDDAELVRHTLRDVVLLEAVGIQVVLIHGGGPAIGRALKEAGISSSFVDGLRITDAATMQVIERVLCGEVGPSIVALLESLGGRARQVLGQRMFQVKPFRKAAPEEGGHSLGFVGEPTSVDTNPILSLLAERVIPVVSPLGLGEDGQLYNINADTAAGCLAGVLRAEKLVYLTDVNGVLRDPQDPRSTISVLNPKEVAVLQERGVLRGGMLPKVRSALWALQAGVGKVHLLDGRIPHALLLEVFTDSGVGTELVP
ncbi:acetylglutamate kinase [Methylacidimicrobium cyclopophantes]|uniref:Acetylglutamate kinase n=1 Tax=Methylacidimicrobium cyclopophantes TaxID=1041766 RepID=A0A5E6MIW6_9BACT|nr:acetylglutamate kinase [Methylacidimicrobium cyclopophantes]VVM05432.1 acetylglutamate kinase [Methylacidimicrobium cyclopophantes]